MRLACLLLLALAATLSAAEQTYPLWDNVESVPDYAKKINLPPTKTIDLGNGVKLELVLIPAGKFIMGTPEPTPVDEAGYQQKIFTGQVWLDISAGALLCMLVFVLVQAIRQKRRPQLSLGLLLLVTVAAGGAVLSWMHWRHSVRALDEAVKEYPAAKARYDDARSDEKPAHLVTLTKPFYMGKFVVTQEQYVAEIGVNPSHLKSKDHPVEMVSWDDAQEFCRILSQKSHQVIRLPTEAEWEYACRAGTKTTYYSGDTEADLSRVAWYYANSKTSTHPVGQKEPNKFGLYDMHGNVFQWCQDWYSYFKTKTEEEQRLSTTFRTARGGCCTHGPIFSKSSNRFRTKLNSHFYDFGFRIVLDP